MDLVQRLARRHAVPRDLGGIGLHLLLEAGDAHHEELIEVRTEDGEEFHPLQQGRMLVPRLLEDAPLKGEQRELAVDVPLRRREVRDGRNGGYDGRCASERGLDGDLRRGRAADEATIAVPNPYHRPRHAAPPCFASDSVYGIHRFARCQPLCREQIRPIGVVPGRVEPP